MPRSISWFPGSRPWTRGSGAGARWSVRPPGWAGRTRGPAPVIRCSIRQLKRSVTVGERGPAAGTGDDGAGRASADHGGVDAPHTTTRPTPGSTVATARAKGSMWPRERRTGRLVVPVLVLPCACPRGTGKDRGRRRDHAPFAAHRAGIRPTFLRSPGHHALPGVLCLGGPNTVALSAERTRVAAPPSRVRRGAVALRWRGRRHRAVRRGGPGPGGSPGNRLRARVETSRPARGLQRAVRPEDFKV